MITTNIALRELIAIVCKRLKIEEDDEIIRGLKWFVHVIVLM